MKTFAFFRVDLSGETQDEQYDALSMRDTRENQESAVSYSKGHTTLHAV